MYENEILKDSIEIFNKTCVEEYVCELQNENNKLKKKIKKLKKKLKKKQRIW